jgi:hypothetical protein
MKTFDLKKREGKQESFFWLDCIREALNSSFEIFVAAFNMEIMDCSSVWIHIGTWFLRLDPSTLLGR